MRHKARGFHKRESQRPKLISELPPERQKELLEVFYEMARRQNRKKLKERPHQQLPPHSHEKPQEPKRPKEFLEAFSFIGRFETNRDTCGNCKAWCGRCLKNHKNRTASSEACEASFRRRRT